MFGATLTPADGVSAATPELPLLDTYAGAVRAYSLRLLRTEYTGPCMRIRRSSDNAEQDIDFVNGAFDTAAIATFCGAGSGFVKTWYDQTASATNYSQTTGASQPIIYSSGSQLDAITFTDASGAAAVPVMTSSAWHTAAQTWLAVTSVYKVTNAIYMPVIEGVFSQLHSTPAGRKTRIAATRTSGLTPADGFDANTGWNQRTSYYDRTALCDRLNGLSNIAVPLATPADFSAPSTYRLGNSSTNSITGVIEVGEVICWTTDIESDLIAIETNQMESVGITPPSFSEFAEGLTLGDSTVAAYLGYTEIADLVYTPAEALTRRGIDTVAYPGDTIAQQKTKFLAYRYSTNLSWVIVQIGLNDMSPAVATATTIAAYQDLINTIRAAVPSTCKVIGSTMVPAYERWVVIYGGSEAAAQAKWVAVNEAVTGGGGSPITGLDGTVSSHTTALAKDVSGNAALADAYDHGDHIHENDAGREIIAAAWRVELESLGLI